MTASIQPSAEEPSLDPQRRAFVVFLMFNDSYLPGALTAAYGLRRQGSLSRRVCVVDPGISVDARTMLAELFDEVIEVEPTAVPDAPLGEGPAPIRTGSARVSGAALTRFSALRLGTDGDLGSGYDKVAVIDADLLPVREFDQLWSLPAPAGIINEHRSHMAEIDPAGNLVVRPESLRTGKWIWHDIYDEICPHGTVIPKEVTDRVALDYSNYGVNASLVLIEPSMNTYDDLMAWVASPDISPLVRIHWPWVDQQAATLYWSGQWTNIDVSFSTLYGYPSVELARGLHYAGVKPWSWRKKGFARRIHRFPDYRLWAEYYLEMFAIIGAFRQYDGLRRLAEELGRALAADPDSFGAATR